MKEKKKKKKNQTMKRDDNYLIHNMYNLSHNV